MRNRAQPSDLRSLLSEAYTYYQQPRLRTETATRSFSSDGQSGSALVPAGRLQDGIRQLYGKGAARPADFGDHPDYAHLKGTDRQEYGPIVTMLMDMEGSTRLGVLLTPAEVYVVKNAFICVAIEVIRAFDGHVHRIMGDAVMAYFGRQRHDISEAALDALNASQVLIYFIKTVIAPQVEARGVKEAPGVRVGLDFGTDEKVLWASYGFGGMEEVTATSFHVDAAAKLQQNAGRNQVMIGDALRDLLDIPEEVLQVPTRIRDGNREVDEFLRPNVTDLNGKPIDYRKYIIRQDTYRSLTPIDREERTRDAERLIALDAMVQYPNAQEYVPYPGAGRLLPKGCGLMFEAVLLRHCQFPYTVKFWKENHGVEAEAAKSTGRFECGTYRVRGADEVVKFQQTEATAYRGLHYMVVELWRDNRQLDAARVGVFIA